MKQIDKVKLLKSFLVENDMQFTWGVRNTDSTVVSGYCLHIELLDSSVIVDVITKVCPNPHWDFESEFTRVFNWAQDNNYGAWWKKEDAKKLWKF
jgi:hypothetical protein